MQNYVVVVLIKIYYSKPSDKLLTNSICIIFLKEHMCGVHQVIYNSKSATSIFRAIIGYIRSFQKCGFWWYQGSIIDCPLTYMYQP